MPSMLSRGAELSGLGDHWRRVYTEPDPQRWWHLHQIPACDEAAGRQDVARVDRPASAQGENVAGAGRLASSEKSMLTWDQISKLRLENVIFPIKYIFSDFLTFDRKTAYIL